MYPDSWSRVELIMDTKGLKRVFIVDPVNKKVAILTTLITQDRKMNHKYGIINY